MGCDRQQLALVIVTNNGDSSARDKQAQAQMGRADTGLSTACVPFTPALHTHLARGEQQGKRQREGGCVLQMAHAQALAGGGRQPLVSGQTRAVMQAYPTLLGRRMGAPACVSRAAPGSHSLLPPALLRPASERPSATSSSFLLLLRGAHPAACDN